MFKWLNNLITQFKLTQDTYENGRVVSIIRELGNYYISVPSNMELPYNYLKDTEEFVLDIDNLPNIDIVATSRFGGIDELCILGTNIEKKFFNEVTIGMTKNKIILWEGFLPVSINVTLIEDFTNILKEKNNKHVRESLGILGDFNSIEVVSDVSEIENLTGLFREIDTTVVDGKGDEQSDEKNNGSDTLFEMKDVEPNEEKEKLNEQPAMVKTKVVKRVRKPRTKKVIV